MGRHFGGAPEATRALVDECTSTIVGEVESLKALVDEFAQFARMPAPRAVPSNLNAVLTDTLALYNGLFSQIRIDREFAPALPPVRLDVEQIRRVVINLVDNAIEAMGGMQAGPRPGGEPPRITIETQHDAANAVARIVISDNGPGVPAADREKLFMPYYSTKGRGQRARPGDRPPHRRGARRVHRGRRQRAAGVAVRIETAVLEADRILIVDDEAGVRSALSGVLRDEGYGVEAVESGEACLDRVVRAPLRRHRARHLAARAWTAWPRWRSCRSAASTRR